MGVAKPVLKTHGSAKADAVVTAIKSVIDFTSTDVIGKIEQNITSMKKKGESEQ